MARPTLAPGLMPDTTRSTGPNTPRRANITHSPGVPLTVHASAIPSTAACLTSGCSRCRAPSAALAPEYSLSGATTTTSPRSVIARASTWRPTESTPSSFVTRIRGMRSGPRRADRLRPPHVPEHGRRLDPRPGALRHGRALVGQPGADAVGAAVVDGD